MSALFGSFPGTASGPYVIPGLDGVAAKITLVGLNDTPGATVVVNSIGVGQGANVQYSMTLQNSLFIYSFGERIGTLTVNGFFLWAGCTAPLTGLQSVLDYYKANSVGSGPFPTTISIAGFGALRGFLDSVHTLKQDTSRGITSFRLTFSSRPELWSPTTP